MELRFLRLFAEASRSCCFGAGCVLPLPTGPKRDSANINIISVSECFVSERRSKKLSLLYLNADSQYHTSSFRQEAVRVLIHHSADVNARDKNWQTPLHVAAANNALRCAEVIIPLLSSVNVSDRGGRTALHHAALNGHTEVRAFVSGCILEASTHTWSQTFLLRLLVCVRW